MNSFFFKHKFAFKWILIALLVKGIFFVWFAREFEQTNWQQENRIIKGVFVEAHDWSDYSSPVMNLVDSGYYGYYIEGKGMIWAHKMPGFIPLMAPTYYLFGYENTCLIISILQFFTDALSCYLVGIIALFLFNSAFAFSIAFWLYLISSFVSTYTHFGCTEPLCTFFIVVSVYYFIKWANTIRKEYLFFCGLFICWAYFLRPAIGVILVIYPLIYLFKINFFKEFPLKKALVDLLLYSSIFIICESAWIYRNFKILDQFVPFDIAATNFATPQYRALISFTSIMAGEQFAYSKDNQLQWFVSSKEYEEVPGIYNANPFTEKNFTPDFNLDSLKALRQIIEYSYTPSLTEQERNKYGDVAVLKINKYKESFKEFHPFRYYIVNKIIMLRKFLFVKQTFALPFEKNSVFQKLVRAFYLGMSTLIIFLGLIGIFLSVIKRKFLAGPLSLVVFSHIFVHAFILGFIEHRYLVTIFPLLAVYSAYTTIILFKRFTPTNKK